MAQLRIGVPEHTLEAALEFFPAGVELIHLPDRPPQPVEVDFWIPPYFATQARATWQQLRGVRVVQALTAGVDWLLHLIPPEVTVCDARGVHDIPTSEWVVAAILAMVKGLPLYRDLQHEGRWSGQQRISPGGEVPMLELPPALPGQLPYRVLAGELAGKRVLIVGYGSIGTAIEARLAPFGVVITRIARIARLDADPAVFSIASLHELLPGADIVILILPSTPQTQGLIDEKAIALLKPGALLVNAARGSIVHTNALLLALRENRICAALDVTDPEPLPYEHPLWHTPNCLITPHIGGSTEAFYLRVFQLAGRQVQRLLDCQPLDNVVPRGQGY